MTNKERKALAEYYPEARYTIGIEADKARIADYLTCKGSTCWSQGPIGDTGFYKLVHCSPQSKGDKQFILVCRAHLVKGIKS